MVFTEPPRQSVEVIVDDAKIKISISSTHFYLNEMTSTGASQISAGVIATTNSLETLDDLSAVLAAFASNMFSRKYAQQQNQCLRAVQPNALS